jgi:hypothetical protein
MGVPDTDYELFDELRFRFWLSIADSILVHIVESGVRPSYDFDCEESGGIDLGLVFVG